MSKIIRTKTQAKGGITAAEKVALATVAQEWIGIAMRTDPIDPSKIIPAIEGLYAAAKLKKPRVVIVPSPMVMAIAYGASASIWHGRKSATSTATSAATYAATRTATSAATYAATSAATDAATSAATDAATYAATEAATYTATRAATEAAIDTSLESGAMSACLDIGGALGVACAKRWWSVYQGGNMWAGWVSALCAYRDVIGLDLPEHTAFKHYETASREGGFRVMHEEFCIVSDFPEVIKKDDQNRPHCETGPSHRWRDGWSLYHWHGVKIPAEWIEDRANLTAKTALTWPNIEQRRAACEIIGWAKILKELDAKVIDRDGDPEIGTLLEVDLPDSGKERFIYVKCGTGREFAIPVPNDCGDTALAANMWTFGLDANAAFIPEVRT